MTTEAPFQQNLRFFASNQGRFLWRNNSGSLQNPAGQWIRFGLGNDSKKLNDHFKSSDLIGITPVVISPQMVGRTLGVFTAVECKPPGWTYKGTGREVAQQNFINLVNQVGGFAGFAQSMEDYERIIGGF